MVWYGMGGPWTCFLFTLARETGRERGKEREREREAPLVENLIIILN